MASKPRSRWADDEDPGAIAAQRKRDKEKKRRVKAEKQRNSEEAQNQPANEPRDQDGEHPVKRRRLSVELQEHRTESMGPEILRFPTAEWGPSRHVDNFEKLNHIEEGSYGWVSRAKETATGEVVALKKLKMEPANDGFPVTGLREIQTLSNCNHLNIVKLREVVMGDSMKEYTPLFLLRI